MEVEENNNEKLKQIGVGDSRIGEDPKIIEILRERITKINEELSKGYDKENTKQMMLKREAIEIRISFILDIEKLIANRENKFKEIKGQFENLQSRKIEIDGETKEIIEKSKKLIEELVSIKQKIEKLDKKSIKSDVELLHIETREKTKLLDENIKELEKKLEEINKSGEEADETTIFGEWAKTPEGKERIAKLSNAINNYADKIEEKNKKDGTKTESAIQKDQEIKGDGGVIGKIKRFYEKSREKTKKFFKKFLGIGNKETNLNLKAEEIERDVKELKDLFEKWQKDPENYTVPFHIKQNELYRKYGGEIDEIIKQMIK